MNYKLVFITSRKTCKNNHSKWMSKTLGSGHELKEENQPLSKGKMYLFNVLIFCVLRKHRKRGMGGKVLLSLKRLAARK